MKNINNKIIILFGSTGMLGRYIHAYFNEFRTLKVICINRNVYDVLNDSFKDIYNSKLNILINNIYKQYPYDNITVVNAIGLIPHTGNKNICDYFKINSQFPHALDKLSVIFKYKLIHITTDCVFNGYQRSGYTEDSIKNESNIYGASKILGDYLDNACIIRTSIIGEQNFNCKYKSLLDWVRSNKYGSIDGYDNHYWNGLTCLKLAKIIFTIIDRNVYWIGVRHFFSQPVSKYELISMINDIYKLNININKINHKYYSNKTLTSLYTTNKIFNQILNSTSDLYTQITEQKHFNINMYINSR
jgi:dTDP-4-dehydrorhamnose reductase